MDDKLKRKKIRNYFSKKVGFGWPAFLVIAGIIVVAIGLNNDEGVACVGAGMVIFGGLMGLNGFVGRLAIPSDRQIDQWFEEDLRGISKHALEKLDLTADLLTEKAPLQIIGPIFWDWDVYGVPEDDMWLKLGGDNTLRYTIISVLYIFTAEHLLAAYECVFNFLKNERLHEDTYEFHYQDIVAVTTHEEARSRVLPHKKKMKKTLKEREFHITVPGESISMIIDSETLTSDLKGDVYRKDDVERTVQRLRSLIRDKKQALASQPIPTSPPPQVSPSNSMPTVPEPGLQAPPPPSDGRAASQAVQTGPRFCSNCGKAVQPAERFCSNCGNALVQPG